jgi:hypothetical protein
MTDLFSKTENLSRNTAVYQDLSAKLHKSVAIRQAYNLPARGTIKVQKIKPSGAGFSDTSTHRVRISLNGEAVAFDTLDNYLEKTGL